MKPSRRIRFLLIVTMATAGLLLHTPPAAAQRIGIEAGLAAVDGFGGPSPVLGITLGTPLMQRVRATATYSRWTGSDASGRLRNQSMDAAVLVRVAGRHGGGGADLGGGIGWFDVTESDRSRLQHAFTLVGDLRTPVALNSSAYARAGIALHPDDSAIRWASFRVGVDVGVF